MILVTARAEFGGAAQLGAAIVVWRVAIRAREHPFADRMVRREGELGRHVQMAADAQLGSVVEIPERDPANDGRTSQLSNLAIVWVVAIGANQTRARMLARRPRQMSGTPRFVASQAVCVARITDIRRFLGILVDAAGPMTGLAILMKGGNRRVSRHLFVADAALFRSDELCICICNWVRTVVRLWHGRRPDRDTRDGASRQRVQEQTRCSLLPRFFADFPIAHITHILDL
jgi:hypothetical protein